MVLNRKMSSIQQWQEMVTQYGEQSVKSNNHWHGNHAAWYDEWITRNDYAKEMYPFLQQYASGHVFEIGAGTGLFTRYLVHDVRHVSALEPSKDMIGYLQKNVGSNDNYTIIPYKIEDYLDFVPDNDFTLAAHALFNVYEIDRVISTLRKRCRWLAMIVGSGRPLRIYKVIREALDHHEVYHAPPNQQHLKGVLDEMEIPYETHLFETETAYFYDSQEEMLQNLAKRVCLPEEKSAGMLTAVEPYISKNNGQVGFRDTREHVLVLLKGERQ